MKYCSKCGAPMANTDRFCPSCGAPAQAAETKANVIPAEASQTNENAAEMRQAYGNAAGSQQMYGNTAGARQANGSAAGTQQNYGNAASSQQSYGNTAGARQANGSASGPQQSYGNASGAQQAYGQANAYSAGNAGTAGNDGNAAWRAGEASDTSRTSPYRYDPVGTVDILAGKMRTIAAAWLVIGIVQIVVGVLSLCVIAGIAPLAMGIYNVVQSSQVRKSAEAFQQWPVGIIDYFTKRETSVIVILILNVVFGLLFGIIGSILEFTTKSYAMDHREELYMAEDMARRSVQ